MSSRDLDAPAKRGVCDFFIVEKAHTFNYVFASILFYAFGIPLVAEYGYSTISYDDALSKVSADGSLPSGRYGQGAFPMTLMLYIVASFLFFSALVRYVKGPENVEEEE